jgi:dephospho-CoA kinase
MERIGLTGGPGMGKTTVARMFQLRGVPVVDTDELARKVVEPGQPAWQEIVAAFGPGIVDETGRLRRAELARIVFSDPGARRTLESITHPRIRQLWHEQMTAWERAGVERALVVIPLLYETGAERELDRVVCVACTRASQYERLRQRGWSDREIEARCAAQWPVEEKMARADHVVWTEGSLLATEAQVDRLLERWCRKAG